MLNRDTWETGCIKYKKYEKRKIDKSQSDAALGE